jgi:hypothetical protein
MRLGHVFQSIAAWKHLASMRMSPKVAYRILKYLKLIDAEYEIIEKQRVALIRELAKVEDGADAKIDPNTPEMAEYVRRFSEILEVSSGLGQFSFSLNDVLADISEDKNNSLSVQELALLEPFFVEN